jgi:hypothetical protein
MDGQQSNQKIHMKFQPKINQMHINLHINLMLIFRQEGQLLNELNIFYISLSYNQNFIHNYIIRKQKYDPIYGLF